MERVIENEQVQQARGRADKITNGAEAYATERVEKAQLVNITEIHSGHYSLKTHSY